MDAVRSVVAICMREEVSQERVKSTFAHRFLTRVVYRISNVQVPWSPSEAHIGERTSRENKTESSELSYKKSLTGLRVTSESRRYVSLLCYSALVIEGYRREKNRLFTKPITGLFSDSPLATADGVRTFAYF